MVTWVAYCPTCQQELDKAPNGALMQAVAKTHADTDGHRVILGFFLDPLPGAGASSEITRLSSAGRGVALL